MESKSKDALVWNRVSTPFTMSLRFIFRKTEQFLAENRHILYHMTDLRQTHIEQFNMLLILLVVSREHSHIIAISKGLVTLHQSFHWSDTIFWKQGNLAEINKHKSQVHCASRLTSSTRFRWNYWIMSWTSPASRALGRTFFLSKWRLTWCVWSVW